MRSVKVTSVQVRAKATVRLDDVEKTGRRGKEYRLILQELESGWCLTREKNASVSLFLVQLIPRVGFSAFLETVHNPCKQSQPTDPRASAGRNDYGLGQREIGSGRVRASGATGLNKIIKRLKEFPRSLTCPGSSPLTLAELPLRQFRGWSRCGEVRGETRRILREGKRMRRTCEWEAERWRLAPGGSFVQQWKRLVSKNRDGYIFNYLKYHSSSSPKFLN